MISIFSGVSLVIFVFCAAVLFLHHRLIGKRGAVDYFFAQFDDLLRERLDLYIDLAEALEDISSLCESYLAAETTQIIKDWAKIQKTIAPIKDDVDKDESLTENAHEMALALRDYNESIAVYNQSIARFPWKIVAFAVGFKAMKPLPKVSL